MTLDDLQSQNLLLFECISGSKAYGLDLPHSDTDIKGVFILPKQQFYGLDYIPQVADNRNDVVYYELGRFIELLMKNNPNILELLATPADKIRIKHPLIDQIKPDLFISKKCKDTFGGYAFTQIRKARGLNKKIVNPVDKERKSILAFCQVLQEQGAIPLSQWLAIHQVEQAQCGLVNIPKMKDLYGLYIDRSKNLGYRGILRKEQSTKVVLSSIPKTEKPIAYLHFNEDGYVKYCKDYKEYWDWVDQRNESRYQNNLRHGQSYDSKNMMHTFRLLDMAKEILETGQVIVKRPNREELLAIRQGKWTFEELMSMADAKMTSIEKAYQNSQLQDEPDTQKIKQLLVALRMELYQ
ncbi:MAG: nucleotidyltransferase domain-containing protein [Bacteroidota bacterium]